MNKFWENLSTGISEVLLPFIRHIYNYLVYFIRATPYKNSYTNIVKSERLIRHTSIISGNVILVKMWVLQVKNIFFKACRNRHKSSLEQMRSFTSWGSSIFFFMIPTALSLICVDTHKVLLCFWIIASVFWGLHSIIKVIKNVWSIWIILFWFRGWFFNRLFNWFLNWLFYWSFFLNWLFYWLVWCYLICPWLHHLLRWIHTSSHGIHISLAVGLVNNSI